MSKEKKNLLNLIDYVEYYAQELGDKPFVSSCALDLSLKTRTYREVYEKATAFSYWLSKNGFNQGQKAILLFADTADSLYAALACLDAGITIIPLAPPTKPSDLNKIERVAIDSNADFIMTSGNLREKLALFISQSPVIRDMKIVCEEDSALEVSHGKLGLKTEILLIQYTSGSTGAPKGIVISNESIMVHLKGLVVIAESDINSVFISWLPYYHDMGLIAMLFLPVYSGSRCVLIPPHLFMADATVWIRAISEFKGTISGAPNFAFELSAKYLEQMDAVSKSKLDFSNVKRLFSGGEAINLGTIVRFCDITKAYGFNRSAILLAYGQAEATLVISGYKVDQAGSWIKADREKLKHQEVQIVEEGKFENLTLDKLEKGVSSVFLPGIGTAVGENHEIVILDINSQEPKDAYGIGEICFVGASIAQGYYNNPDETSKNFSKDKSGRRLLRTGDLGFLNSEGELFITGRIKDIIIINGENFYPEDIEQAAYSSDSCAIPLATAAFAQPREDTEQLVVLQEIIPEGFARSEAIADAIRRNILNVHGIGDIKVILASESSIPKTDSGKIQRSKAKQMSECGEFELVFDYAKKALSDSIIDSKDGVYNAVFKLTANAAGISAEQIDEDRTFLQYGISSIALVRLCEKISLAFDAAVTPVVLLEHDTPNSLSEYLLSNNGHSGAELSFEHVRVIPQEQRYLPNELSYVQRAYLDGRNPELPLGGVSCYYYMEVDALALDKDRFSDAVRTLMERHDNLHAVLTDDGKICVTPEWENPLVVYSLEQQKNPKQHLEKLRNEMQEQVIGAGKFLFDLRLSELESGGYRIHFGIDMIIADAYAILLLQEELKKLYDREALPKIEHIVKPSYIMPTDSDKEYWLNRADTFPKAPTLPLNAKFHDNSVGRFARRKFNVERKLWNSCKSYVIDQGLSPSSVLFALYAEVLSAWSGENNFAVMTTVVGREDIAMNTVDDFTRLSLTELCIQNQSIASNAIQIQKQLISDLAHGSLDAVQFVRELSHRNGEQQSYPYVFTCALDTNRGTKDVDIVYSCSQTPQVLIDCQALEYDGELHISWDTIDDAFVQGVVDDMFGAMKTLVQTMAEKPDFVHEVLKDIRPKDQKKIIAQANSTGKHIAPSLLTANLAEIARTSPDHMAIIAKDKSLTYSQLYDRALQFAGLCINAGVQQGDSVLIETDRTSDMAASVIGVLLAGGVYVPVTKHQPENRIKQIIEACDAKYVITDEDNLDLGIKSLYVSEANAVDYSEAELPEISCDQSAYIIFTSGSTGVPKGVEITHESAMNTILDVNERLDICSADVAICVSELNFDLSVYDVFGMLNAGGCLVVADEKQRIDMTMLYELCEKYKVTFWNSVPAIFEMFVDRIYNDAACSLNLRNVILSGDWIPLNLPEKMGKVLPKAKLISMGGATEASIWSNYYDVNSVNAEWKSIPYGFPLSNQQFYILNSLGRPCPMMVEGKLYIAGKGLAVGYIGDREKTEKSFFVHPELKIRLYDTGDNGRYYRDGCIEFLGRRDNQVKVNGFRIETGEIQCALAAIGFEDAIVAVDGKGSEAKRLVAFIKTDLDTKELEVYKKALANHIPSYMIPDALLAVEEFPMTANGKRDIKALMGVYKDYVREKAYQETAGESSAVIQIISEIIGVVPQSSKSFYELGMASVDLIRLGNKLEAAYGVRPSISEIMSYGSVQELVDFYADKSAKVNQHEAHGDLQFSREVEKLYQICRTKGIKLKLAGGALKFNAPVGAMTAEIKAEIKRHRQEMMTYLEEIDKHPEGNGKYMPFMLTPIQQSYVTGRSTDFELGGFGTHYFIEMSCDSLDVDKFESALNEVVAHHDALRTVVFDDGTQMVLMDVPHFNVRVSDCSPDELLALKEKWKKRRFSLNEYPLFDVEVAKLPGGSVRIFFGFDCLILDGASSHQMIEELFAIYSGENRTAPDYSFCRYILDSSKMQKSRYDKDKEYWERRAKQLPPAPAFEYVTPLSEIKEHHFKRLEYSFDRTDSLLFTKRAAQTGYTASAVAATLYMKVLSRWSGNRNVTVNMTMFNRMPVNDDVMDILGDFTGTTFISYNTESKRFADAVAYTQSQIWDAIEHRSFSGVDVLKLLTNEENRWSAIMPVVFTSLFYDNDDTNSLMLPQGFEITDALSETPQVVLDHQIYNRGGSITVVWDFVMEALAENEVKKHFDMYCELIKRVIDGSMEV